ncbi:hypothetical protein [Chitinophaga cymbidii]|uniref:Uncharacterized protein n=1 Tax=Chitinophaga cymbidii TaxID=1096750 RepID=A0A512RRS8_9BACT|nr:hypothetical protein [Chitinophaga cymbidii]GEP98411.1 hypothetical protein CCY01nite_46710 [Chitinophaga cymbidii]
MKRLILSLSVISLTLSGFQAFAQSGVYLSAKDFENAKLSYTEHHINAHIPLRYSKVKVNTPGETLLLNKSEVFGYRDEKQRDYRFINNHAYRILDHQYFHVYSRDVEVSKGKGRIKETKYYFSTHADGEMHPLTIANLKKAFPEHKRFHELLDMQFRHDPELAWYDQHAQQFKVKSIFEQSI